MTKFDEEELTEHLLEEVKKIATKLFEATEDIFFVSNETLFLNALVALVSFYLAHMAQNDEKEVEMIDYFHSALRACSKKRKDKDK